MWPVPATKVKVQVVSGATIVTYLGLARMIALGDAHEEVDAAGGLHHRGGHDDRQDDQHDVDRGRGGVHPEGDDEDQQADRAPEAEADAAVARAHPDGGEHDHELQDD